MREWDLITLDQLRSRPTVKWSVDSDVIAAWVAEMDFGTAPAVLEAWRLSGENAEFGYVAESIVAEMAEATSQWYAERYGWRVDPAQISPIADVIKGLELAILEFSAPDAPVIVPTPAYMPFLDVPPMLGRAVIQVPMLVDDDGLFRLDLDAIGLHLAAGAGLVILANPGNPTGRVFERDELAALAAVVDAHGARVFSDEIHAPLTLFGARHIPFASVSDAAYRVAITATSASKAFNLPGLKCAQLILTADADLQRWKTIGFLASHGASTPGIRANTAAYLGGHDWLDTVVSYVGENYRALVDGLAALAPDAVVTPLQGTYLTWIDLSAYGLAGEAGEIVLERGRLLVNSGSTFGAGYAGSIRMNIATPRPILEQAIERLAKTVTAP